VFDREIVKGDSSPHDPQSFLVRDYYVPSEEQLQKLWPIILTILKELKSNQILQQLLASDETGEIE
jgi:hypothetical protein